MDIQNHDDKEHLLFLCHRIPYPPNKGDKIRSYNLLIELGSKYHLHLGCFIDDNEDWQHRDSVDNYCASSKYLALNPKKAKMKSLLGLLRNEPLTIPYYHNHFMEEWTKETIRKYKISRCVVFSSAMAQYLLSPALGASRKIIDFVDVDSDKWRQYASGRRGLGAWIYKREANRLEDYDKEVAKRFNVSVFVSEDEAKLFRHLLDDDSIPVKHMANGVDTDYFSPELSLPSPYPEEGKRIVFTGAMDYWANVDAVEWFVKEVFPKLSASFDDLVFYIVGSNPGDPVKQLATKRVVVTGRVPDVRPYLIHADVVVAPMRIARGIQNKVLEGMAMGKPVIVTSKGLEGIKAQAGKDILLADRPEEFETQLVAILNHEHESMGARARNYVCQQCSWRSSLKHFVGFIENTNP